MQQVSDNGTTDKHIHFAREVSKKFVGRNGLVQKAMNTLNAESSFKENGGLLVIAGKSGSGKTAFMVRVYTDFFILHLKFFNFITSTLFPNFELS